MTLALGLTPTLTLAKAEARAAKEAAREEAKEAARVAKEQAKEAARAEREAAKAAAKAKAEEERAAAKAAAAKAREAERGTPAARAAKVAKRGGGKQRADYTTGLMEAYGGAGDEGEGEEEEEDTPCAVCGGVESNPGNEMLLCDGEGCGRGYHQYCCALACPARAALCSATAGHAGREVRTALGLYLARGALRAQGAVAAPAPPPAWAGGQA